MHVHLPARFFNVGHCAPVNMGRPAWGEIHNMKRLPLLASFVLFIALCASLAYWGLQLFKPPLRPVAAPPRAAQPEVRPEAAAALFGGRTGNVAVASNYQLKGIIFSGSPRNSVAILSADGKPAQAVRVDMEVAPGVTVAEVHREYVLLSEGGTTKRVELPESAKRQADLASLAPVPVQPSAVAAPASPPIPSRAQAASAPTPPGTGAAASAPVAAPTQPPAVPPSAAPTASPIPQGVVPSVQPAPAVPPTVVVSPPPAGQQQATQAGTPSPSSAPATPAAPAVAVQPPASTPPAAAPARAPSPDTAPLISR